MHHHLLQHIASPKTYHQPNFHHSIRDFLQFLDHLANLKIAILHAEKLFEKRLTLDGVFNAVIGEVLNQSLFLTKNGSKLVIREKRDPGP